MESIQGRSSLLKNDLQELSATVINTDWIKDAITLVDTLVKGINKVVGSLKSANVIIGAITGTVMGLSGKSFFKIGKDKSGSLFNFLEQLSKLRKNGGIFNPESVLGDQVAITDDKIERFVNLEGWRDAKTHVEKIWGSVEDFKGALPAAQSQQWGQFMEDLEAGKLKVDDMVRSVGDGANKTFNFVDREANAAVVSLQNIGDKIVGVGQTIVRSMGNMLIATIASFIISTVIKFVADTITKNFNKNDNDIKAGKEAREELEKQLDEVKSKYEDLNNLAIKIKVDNAETNELDENLEGIAERYEELHEGVDGLSNANNKLSTKKYQEYLDISNTLADKFPLLVKGYDDQGNAILDLGTKSETAAEKLMRVYEITSEIASVDIAKNLNTTFQGLIAQVAKQEDELTKLKEETKTLDSYQDYEITDTGAIFTFSNITDFNTWVEGWKSALNLSYDDFNEMFGDMYQEMSQYLSEETGDTISSALYTNNNKFVKENIEKFVDALPWLNNKALTSGFQAEALKENNQQQNVARAAIEQANAEFVGVINDYLNSGLNIEFKSQNSVLTDAIIANLSQFDLQEAERQIKESGLESGNFVQWANRFIVSVITSIDEEVQASVADIIKQDYSNLTLGKYWTTINENILGAVGDSVRSGSLINILGIRKFYEDQINKQIDLKRTLSPIGVDESFINNLSLADLDKAYDLISKTDYKYGSVFMRDFNTDPKAKAGTFNDILDDETVTEQLDQYKKYLDALVTGIQDANEHSGQLIGEARNTLVEAMKDSGFEFDPLITSDQLSEAALEQISKYTELLFEQADAYELDGKNMQLVISYMQNFLEQYSDFNINPSDIIQSATDNRKMGLLSQTEDESDMKGIQARVEQFAKDFNTEFQEEFKNAEDRKILYELSLVNPDSKDWGVSKWREQFDNLKLILSPQLDMTEFEKDMALLEARIDAVQQDKDLQQTKIEAKQNRGDYNIAPEIDQQIKDTQIMIENYKQQIKDLYSPNNKEGLAYGIENNLFEFGDQKYLEAAEKIENKARDLTKQIIQLREESVSLAESKLDIPLTIIDKKEGGLEDLEKQFSDVIKPAIDKFGENTVVDSNLLDSAVDNITSQLGSNQAKLDIVNAVLETDISEETRKRFEEYKSTLTGNIQTLTEDLNKYSDDVLFSEDKINLAKAEARKGVLQSLQKASGLQMTEQDYENLETANKEILGIIEQVVANANQEMNNLLKNGTIDYEDLGAEDKRHFDELLATYQEFVTKQAEISAEMVENNKSIHLLPITQLEEDLTKLQEYGSLMKANIDNIKSLGEETVDDTLYERYAANLGQQEVRNTELANRYLALYTSAQNGDPDRNGYWSKYVSYTNAAASNSQEIEQVMDEMDAKSIEALTLAMDRLNVEYERLEDNIENAKRPLTQGDYQKSLDNIAKKIENIGLQQDYWNDRMEAYVQTVKKDGKEIDKQSQEYLEIEKGLNGCDSAMRQLVHTQDQLNKSMKQLPFDEIDKKLEEYQQHLSSLNLAVELKIAQGGKKEESDYTEEQKIMEKEMDNATERMQTALDQAMETLSFSDISRDRVEEIFKMPTSEEISDAINAELRNANIKAPEKKLEVSDLVRLDGSDLDLSQIGADVFSSQIATAMSPAFANQMINDLDENALLLNADQYKEGNDQYTTYQTDMTKSQKEQSELRLNNLEEELKTAERFTGEAQRANQKILDTGNDLTANNIANMTEAYNGEMEALVALSAELQTKMLTANKSDYETYKTRLDEVQQRMDEISQSRIELRTTTARQNIENLKQDMETLDATYQKLEDNISNPHSTTNKSDTYSQMLQVNEQRYNNAMAQAGQQDMLANFYRIAYGEESDFYKEAVKGANEARESAEKYREAIKTVGDEIRRLPENMIADRLGLLSARGGAERGALERKTTQSNGVIHAEDYDDILKSDQDNIKEQGHLLDILSTERDKANREYNDALAALGDPAKIPTEVLDKYYNANKEYSQAEADLYSSQEQLAKDHEAANEALLSDYNESMRLVGVQKQGIDNQKLVDDAMGKIRGRAEIEADISISQASLSNAMEALNNLDESQYQGENAHQQFLDDQAALEEAAAQAQAELIKLGQEEDMIPVNNIQRLLDTYEDEWADLQRIQEKVKREGGDLTDSQNQDMLDNIDNRRKWLEKLQDIYTRLYEANKGTTVGDSMNDGIEQTKQALASLDAEEYEIKYNIDTKPLTDLQESMGYLTREAEDLKAALDDPSTSTMSRADVLNGLIKNNADQINNLNGQIGQYEARMQAIQQANPEDYLFNDEYIKAAEGLSSATQGIKNLTVETKNYVETIRNLPMENIERMLAYLEALKGLQTTANNLKVAQGDTLTSDDYDGIIDTVEREVTRRQDALVLAQGKVAEKQAALNFARLNPTLANVEQAEINYENAITDATKAEEEALSAQIDVINARKEAFEAGQAVFENARSMAEAERSVTEAERELAEARGEDVRTTATIQADIEFSAESKKSLQQQLDDLELNHVGLSDLEYAQKHAEIEAAILNTDKQIFEYNKELAELPIRNTEREYENLKKQSDELEIIINRFKNLDQEVPDNFLNQKLLDIQSQRESVTAIRNFYVGLIDKAEKSGAFGELFADLFGWNDKVAEMNAELANLDTEEYNTKNEQSQKTIRELNNELDVLQRNTEKTQKILNDGKVPKTPELYRTAIKEAGEQQANLISQMAEVRAQMANFTNENDPGYQMLLEQLNSLQDNFDGLTESVNEWSDAMKNLRVDSMIKDLQEFEKQFNTKSDNQDQLVSTLGYRLTDSDYANRQGDYGYLAQQAQSIANEFATQAGSIEARFDESLRQSAMASYEEWMDKAKEYQFMADNTIPLEQAKAPISELETAMNELSSQADVVQSQVDQLVADGYVGTEEQYNSLIDFNNQQLENIDSQIEAWKNYKTVFETLAEIAGVSLENNEEYLKIEQEIRRLEQEERPLRESNLENALMINGGRQLVAYKQQMEELERENTKFAESIESIRNKGEVVSASDYNDIVDNISRQIENLTKTNELLEIQQSTVNITKSKYDELSATIDGNVSSINTLIENLDQYNKELLNFAENQANTLSGIIDSVLSESFSKTGISTESIQNLVGQFSQLRDIADVNLANLFYHTADGIKLNQTELERLVNIQKSAFSQNIMNNISRENELILQQTKKIAENGNITTKSDKQMLDGHKKKLSALRDELTQYNAISQSILDSINYYAQWQNATSTENLRAKYEAITSGMLEAEAAYNRGETGTDEFKALTKLISVSGEDTEQAFMDSYYAVARYFNDNTEGLNNAIDDMMAKGFAEEVDGKIRFSMLDPETLKSLAEDVFHVSEEATNIILDALREQGYDIPQVTDALDAQTQILDKSDQLIEKHRQFAEAVINMDANTATRLYEEIKQLQSDIDALNEYATFSPVTIDENEFNSQLKLAENLWLQAQKETNELAKQSLEEEANTIANSLFTTIDADGKISQTYDEYLISAENAQKSLIDSLPKIDEITEAAINSYRSGFEQLKDIAEENNLAIDWDTFENIDSAKLDEIGEFARSLKSFDGLVEVNPAAQNALNQISQITKNQRNLRIVLDFQERNGAEANTIETLAKLTDDKMLEVITSVGIQGEDAEALMQYIKNKAAEIPMTIKIDDTQFKQLLDLYKVPIQPTIDNQAKEEFNNEIQNMETDPVQVDVEAKDGSYLDDYVNQFKEKFANLKENFSISNEVAPLVSIAKMIAKAGMGFPTTPIDMLDFGAALGNSKVVDAISGPSVAFNAQLSPELQEVKTKFDGAFTRLLDLYETAKSIGEVFGVINDSGNLPRVDVEVDRDTLVNSVESAFDNIKFKIKATVETTSDTTTSSGHAYGTIGQAFVNGTKDGALAQDGNALVNELGTEMKIDKNGVATLLPGGPHVESLKRGDVILNHKQTEDIMKTGKTSGHGKVVGGMSAFAPGTSPLSVFSSRQNRGKEEFDMIQKELSRGTEALERLTSKLGEVVDVEEKQSILTRQSVEINSQLSRQQQAVEYYQRRASQKASNYEYIDSNGNRQSYNLRKNLSRFGFESLEELVNGGSMRIKEIDTSQEGATEFIQAANNYISLIEQVKESKKAVADLTEQLHGNREAINQLPYDEMERNLHRINNEMNALNSFSNTLSSGPSSIKYLREVMQDTFGDKADSIFNTTGSYLDILNEATDKSIELEKRNLQEHKNTMEQAQQEIEQILSDREDAQKNVDKMKDYILSHATGLDEEAISAIENGELVLDPAKSEGYQGILEKYNELVLALKNLVIELTNANDKYNDEVANTEQAVANYANSLAQRLEERFANIDKTYAPTINYNDAVSNRARAQADYMTRVYRASADPQAVIGAYRNSAAATMNSIDAKRNIVNMYRQEMANAGVVEGSEEWLKYQAIIEQAEAEIINLQSSLYDTYEQMANVPNKIMEEKLQRIEAAYHAVDVAISSGLTDSTAMINAYNRLVSQLGAPNSLGISVSGAGYQATIALLDMATQKAKEEAAVAVEAYYQAKALLEAATTIEEISAAQAAYDRAKSIMDEKLIQAAVAEVRNFEQSVQAIDKYFQNIISHIDVMLTKLKVAKQFLEIGNGYSVNAEGIVQNIADQMGNVTQQIATYEQDIAEMQARLNQGVASGIIQVGDETWLALDTSINQVRNNMENLRLTQLQLYEELANVPNKVVEAKLKEIEWAYSNLTSVMNANIATSMAAINLYRYHASNVGEDIFAGTDFSKEYEYQNYLIERNIEMMKEEVNVAVQGYANARGRYLAGGTEEQMRINREAMETARSLMNEKIAQLAMAEVNKLEDEVKNIMDYYRAIADYVNAIVNTSKTWAQLFTEKGLDKFSRQVEYYYSDSRDRLVKLEQDLGNAYWETWGVLYDGIQNGTIAIGDTEWLRLHTQLENLDEELGQLRLNQLDLFKEMLQVPAKEAGQLIDEITAKYSDLNAIMSNNIQDSLSATNWWNGPSVLVQPNDQIYVAELGFAGQYINPEKETYKRQNNMLQQNLNKEMEILHARKEEYAQAKENAQFLFEREEDRRAAMEALHEAESKYQEQRAKVAKLAVDRVAESMENVQSYYQSLIDYEKALSDSIRSEREFRTRYLGYGQADYGAHYNGYADGIRNDILKEIEYVDNSIENTRTSISEMERELLRGVSAGDIVVGDEKWKELNATILDAKSSLVSYREEHMNLFSELIDLPMKQYEERLDHITNKYNKLNIAISDNISKSASYVALMNALDDRDDTVLRRNYEYDGRVNRIRYTYGNNSPEYMNYFIDMQDNIEQTNEKLKLAYQTYVDYYDQYNSMVFKDGAEQREYQLKLNEARENFYKVEAESARQHVDTMSDILRSIRDYYDSLNSVIEASNSKLQAQRDNIIKYLGYEGNTHQLGRSYQTSIFEQLSMYDNYQYSIATQQEQLRKALNDNVFEYNSQEYREAKQGIHNTMEQLENIKASYLELIREMLSMPINLVTESIDKLSVKFRALTSAMEENVLETSGSARFFAELQDYMTTQAKGSFIGSISGYVSGQNGVTEYGSNMPSYIGQNRAILDDFERQRQELSLYLQSAVATREQYEKILNDAGSTDEERRVALDIMNEAAQLAQDTLAKFAKAESEILGTLVQNLEAYFTRIRNFISSINNQLQATREYTIDIFGYTKQYSKISQNIKQSISNEELSLKAIEYEYTKINKMLNEGLANNWLKVTDDEFIELQTELQNLGSELIDVANNLYQLYETYYNMPNEIASESIEKLGKKYQNLTNIINSNILETKAGQVALKNLAEEYAKTNKYINVNQFDFAFGETFVGQNAAIAIEIDRLMEEINIFNKAVLDTGENLDDLLNGSGPGLSFTQSIEPIKPDDIFEDFEDFDGIVDQLADDLFDGLDELLPAEESIEDILSPIDDLFEEISLEAEDSIDELGDSISSFTDDLSYNTALQIEEIDTIKEKAIAAENAFEESTKNLSSVMSENISKIIQLVKQQITNIGNYYNSLIQYQDAVSGRFASTISTIEQLGRAMNSNGVLVTDTQAIITNYQGQIDALTEKQKLLTTSIVEQERQLEKVAKILPKDSEEYLEIQSNLMGLRNEYDNVIISIDKLQDTMRQELYVKPIEEAITKLQELRNTFTAVNSLINQESKITEEGRYTDQGILSLTFDMASYNASKEELEKAIQEYRVINERWREDASYSDEQYLNDRKTVIGEIQSTMASMNNYQESILNQVKNRYKTEIDYIKKLIQAQSDELSKRKELADYDRTLKDKSNTVKDLERQVRALENLSDLESKAKKARLEEQLTKAREDLDETVQDHVVQLRQEGLSELSKKLDEGYEKFSKDLAVDFDRTRQVMKDMETNLKDSEDIANNALGNMISGFSENLSTDMTISVSNLGLDIAGLHASDLEATEQMEKEKAEKLHQYETDKLNSINNLRSEEAIRAQLEEQARTAYEQNQDLKYDEMKSNIESIETFIDSLNNNTNLIKDAVLTFISKDELLDKFALPLNTSLDNIKADLDLYKNGDTEIGSTVKDSLRELKRINELLGNITSEEHRQAINQSALDNTISLSSFAEVMDEVNEERNNSKYVDGKKYTLSNGKLESFGGSYQTVLTARGDALKEHIMENTLTKSDFGTGRYKVDNTSKMVNGEKYYLITESTALSQDDADKVLGKFISESIAKEFGVYAEGQEFTVGSFNSVRDILSEGIVVPVDGTKTVSTPGQNYRNDYFTAYGTELYNPNMPIEVWTPGKGISTFINDGSLTKEVSRAVYDSYIQTGNTNYSAHTNGRDYTSGSILIPEEEYGIMAPSSEPSLGFTQGDAYVVQTDETDIGFSSDIGNGSYVLLPIDDYTRTRRYASGTNKAKKGLAKINEKGLETIVTSKGTFLPFDGGEGVIPAKQTENLMRLANSVANGNLKLQMPDMSAYQVPNMKVSTNVNNYNIHFDSLINIDGNADETTVNQIKDIANKLISNRQFGEAITQVVSRRQAQDGRMAGKRVSVK